MVDPEPETTCTLIPLNWSVVPVERADLNLARLADARGAHLQRAVQGVLDAERARDGMRWRRGREAECSESYCIECPFHGLTFLPPELAKVLRA